jgi:hypothetical protein
VEGIGIREKLVAEGIDVRNSGGAVGLGHLGILPCGLLSVLRRRRRHASGGRGGHGGRR